VSNIPSPAQALRWFDPRARQAGSWAFILNRLSALGLTFYLGLHLAVLNKLAQGPQSYDDFVALSQSPLIRAGEVILIAAVLFHGLTCSPPPNSVFAGIWGHPFPCGDLRRVCFAEDGWGSISTCPSFAIINSGFP
jgi:hypothetical protein